MNRKIVSVLLLLLTGLSVSAQTTDKKIERIRAYYTDISEKARLAESDDDTGEFGDLVVNELVINKRNHQWRAVGIYGQTYKFFYNGGDDEKHLYPDQLVLVVNARKASDRNYREEFLFSAAGALLYYFYKDDISETKPSEIKVYFSAGKAIRIEQDGRTRDRMTKADVFTTNQRLATATKLMQFFKRSIDL